MENKSTKMIHEILYIEIKKLICIVSISLLLYILIIFSYVNNATLNFPLVGITYLVGSSCMLIIIKSTSTIYKKDYFKTIRLLYLCIGIVNAKDIVPFNTCGVLIFYSNEDLINKSILVLLIALIYYITKRTITNKKNMIIVFVIILIAAYVVKISLNQGLVSAIIIVLLNISAICTTIICQNYFGKFPKIENGEVNFLNLGGYTVYTVAIMNLVRLFALEYSYIFGIISTGILYIGFITICIIIINKIVNNPNKIIFRQLYDKNIELNELNKKIIIQNRELEFSQILIKKKDNIAKSFFRNIPIPLVFLNKGSKRITFANRSFMELTERNSLKDIINKKLEIFISSESEVNNEDNIFYRGTMTMNGITKYVSIEVIDESEDQEEIIIYFTDITEKVRMQDMKETLKNKIFEEKLKRDFLSNISHDLKTPVNVIYSASQLIDMYIKDSNYSGISKYNIISKQNCLSLTRFTNNLIDRSKIFAANLSVSFIIINIVELVENIVSTLVDYAKNKNIDLIFDTEEEELYAKVDCEFMQRIMLNLISNSIKYCNDRGEICVTIKCVGNEIKIIIEDNGVGMDEEFLNTAFIRYSMGKNNELFLEKGTGIGLFVVKNLVEEQGGKIIISSKVNYGTKIELTFDKVEKC